VQRRHVSWIVTSHETDLKPDTRLGDCLQRSMRVGQRDCEGLLRKDVFAGLGRGGDCPGMKLVGSGDHNAIDVPKFEHRLKAVLGMIDFQFSGNLPSALPGYISDSDQTSLRYKAAKIFGVTLAHFTNAKDPNAQFLHRMTILIALAL
jgi:hypothetical protein